MHKLPMCETFQRLGATEFLAAVNERRRVN